MSFSKPPPEPDREDLFVTAPFSKCDPLHNGLHEMEDTMRCNICREFIQIPVSLPCLHYFCSVCIRASIKKQKTGMKRKAWCPMCGIEIREDDLMPNPIVETLVKQYTALRPVLAHELAVAAATTTLRGDQQEEDSKIPASIDQVEDGSEVEPKRRRTTRSTSSLSASAASITLPASSAAQASRPQLKRKSSTHYSALKHAGLVELCEKEGLSTKGSDAQLKARHEEFCKLYNAQCDSAYPLSPQEIARIVNKQEQARKDHAKGTHATHTALMAQLKENRKAMGENKNDSGIAKSGNKDFDAKFKAGFDSLISKMPARPKKRPWVDTTDYDALEKQATVSKDNEMQSAQLDQKENAQDAAVEKPVATTAALSVATLPTTTNKAPPINPYASNTSTSGSSKKATNAKPPPANSARKPARSSHLMTHFLQAKTTPASARKTPSSPSQKSTSSSASSSSRRSSLFGTWHCHVCTFLNEKNTWSRATCEMCGTQRNAPATTESTAVLLDV